MTTHDFVQYPRWTRVSQLSFPFPIISARIKPIYGYTVWKKFSKNSNWVVGWRGGAGRGRAGGQLNLQFWADQLSLFGPGGGADFVRNITGSPSPRIFGTNYLDKIIWKGYISQYSNRKFLTVVHSLKHKMHQMQIRVLRITKNFSRSKTNELFWPLWGKHLLCSWVLRL